VDDHAIADGGLAGGDELGDAFDFDEADAAGGDDGEAWVIAVVGEFDVAVEAGLEDHLAILSLEEFSIDGDFGYKVGMIAGIVRNFTSGFWTRAISLMIVGLLMPIMPTALASCFRMIFRVD